MIIIIMKKGKLVKSDGIVLPDGKVVKDIEEKEYRYLGVYNLPFKTYGTLFMRQTQFSQVRI